MSDVVAIKHLRRDALLEQGLVHGIGLQAHPRRAQGRHSPFCRSARG
ncbi:MAG: hypothetical protein NWQ25_07175 [Prochlorococcaceae cyanobacterium MAG_34]|nr:hypothetical protein [Prochlorococcaceae cyanobacterium MAG_34]